MKKSTQLCPQKDINIRISKESKNQLDWLKITYNFSSFSDCIYHIYYFFKRNNIAPRDQIANVFLNNFLELKNEITNLKADKKENSTRNEKQLKTIEKDILTPMSRKINILFENQSNQNLEKRNEFLIAKSEEPNNIRKKEDEIIKLRRDYNSKDQLNKLMEETIEDINKDLFFYRRLLKILIENTKIEKQLIGKDKIVIDWEIENWKEILEYVEISKRRG